MPPLGPVRREGPFQQHRVAGVVQDAEGVEVWPQVSCRPLVFQMNLAEPFTLNMRQSFQQLMSKTRDERKEAYADPSFRDLVARFAPFHASPSARGRCPPGSRMPGCDTRDPRIGTRRLPALHARGQRGDDDGGQGRQDGLAGRQLPRQPQAVEAVVALAPKYRAAPGVAPTEMARQE